MRSRMYFVVLVLLLFSTAVAAQTRTARTTLDIYVVDVEGGNAVLFVTPSGESALIDSGNAGAGAVRDAERIVAAAKDAGLTKIDHLITTHYHGDHIGGLAELATRIPIMEFVDHGPNTQPNATTDAFLQGGYRELYTKTKHTVAKPGDKIPVAGLDWRVATSATQVLQTPLQGKATPNRYCANFTPQAGVNLTEDDQSLGSVITCQCRQSESDRDKQRHSQRRSTGCNEDLLQRAACRGCLADSLFAAWGAGIHGPRNVHCEPVRSAA